MEVKCTMINGECHAKDGVICRHVYGACQFQELQGTQDKRSPNWLEKQFDEVEKEVDKWPDWKKGESLEKKHED